jgi:hypothetical protein
MTARARPSPLALCRLQAPSDKLKTEEQIECMLTLVAFRQDIFPFLHFQLHNYNSFFYIVADPSEKGNSLEHVPRIYVFIGMYPLSIHLRH